MVVRYGKRTLRSGLALLLVAWVGLPSLLLAGPRAVLVGEAHRDAGKVEPNDVQHLTFQLRNEGDATLMIEDMEPTCYCTSSKTDLWDIPPGGVATLQIRIDPSDFVGAVTKGVEVVTNDPDNPTVLIDVDLFVLPGIAVVPPELDFGTVPAQGSKRSEKIDIKAPRSRDFEVTGVTSEVAFLELEHEPLDLEERHGAMVFVKVLPGAPTGPFEATVIVHTSDPELPTIEIPVRGRGAGGLSAAPNRLTFELTAAGEKVGSFDVQGAQDIQASSSNAGLVTEVEKLPDGGARVHLRLAADARPGRLMAKVQVTLLQGNDPGVSVAVMGMVR